MSTNIAYIKQRNELRYDQIQWHIGQIFDLANKSTKNSYLSMSLPGEPKKIQIHDKKRLFLLQKEEYIDEIIKKNEYADQDIFMAPATYTKDADGRKKENLESFWGIIVDIDDIECDAEDYIEMLYDTKLFDEIPAPGYWISSGRGLYAVYLLNHATAKDKGLSELYYMIKCKLYDAYNADYKSLELNHLYRMPGTINHKSNAEAYIVDFHEIKYHKPQRWWISDLADELGYTKEFLNQQREAEAIARTAKAIGRTNEVLNLDVFKQRKKSKKKRSGILSTSVLRVRDIEYLVCSRVGNGISLDGYRNEILISYAIYLYYSYYSNLEKEETHTIIEEKIAALNRAFQDEKLEYSRVELAISYARTSVENLVKNQGIKEFRYKYCKKTHCMIQNTNWRFDDGIYYHNTDTLIKRLDITKEEMDFMQQLADEDIRKKRINERRNESKRLARKEKNGMTKKQNSMIKRRVEVAGLHRQGHSIKEIASQLNVSGTTIRRDLQSLKSSFMKED